MSMADYNKGGYPYSIGGICGTTKSAAELLQEEIAKLREQLEENQAYVFKIEQLSKANASLVEIMHNSAARSDRIQDAELDKAREEGRKEAVQECIIAIEESQPPETTPWDCVDAIRRKIATAYVPDMKQC